ncbi:hypothetical protein DBR39_00385 [Chryseobacterium sp. KBW03]|nr:hypothetical protein DBR39_00385 [Chryseobacterium sp. KBW03]
MLFPIIIIRNNFKFRLKPIPIEFLLLKSKKIYTAFVIPKESKQDVCDLNKNKKRLFHLKQPFYNKFR